MAVDSVRQGISSISQICFILLVVGLPFANGFLMLTSWYFTWVYFRELRIYNWNKKQVPDPFKNMVYDQQICHSLGKDHKYFEVELRGKLLATYRFGGLRLQLQREDEGAAQPQKGKG
jgi:hypothetical protein